MVLAACGGSAFSTGSDAQTADEGGQLLGEASPESSADASGPMDTGSPETDVPSTDASSPPSPGVDAASSKDGAVDARDGGVDAVADVAQEHELEACAPVFLCGAGGCPLPYVACTSSSAPHCLNTVCCQACN